MSVYHFTCTARFPWIVATGELRPGRNQIGGYPVDFLWATTNCQGDRTASGMRGYRTGHTALIRLTLHAEDFVPWPDILKDFPQWTPDHVRRLQAVARRHGETNFSNWRTRAEPLPLARVVSAEAKIYTGRWKPIELASAAPHRNDPLLSGVLVDGNVYCSRQTAKPGQATQYEIGKMSPAAWAQSNAGPNNLQPGGQS